MQKTILTGVVISKGYDNQPAIRFSEKGDCARFKVGCKVYDKRAENNARWINFSVKAFGSLAERISKMGLKESSYVNLSGRPDEDVWDDHGTTKRQPVIILDEIEYCFSGEKKQSAQSETPEAQETPPDPAGNGTFTGYEPFSGGNELY